ncbi:alpha-glucosidase-like [Venturia canescens]|uniref:alpha-glucosidase-like n=1 Tax=Venturia canescens TaxID=32260 RepID=UPI001C9CAB19|nr:alpha-glucosidase-like [Venturia canescens]
MDRVIYERSTSLNGSVIGSNDYLAVTKKASLRDRILLSPVVKYGVTTVIAIACLMTLVYLSMYFALNNTNDNWSWTCNIRTDYRVDCFPGRLNVTYDDCNDADCCWDQGNTFCYHSIPSRHGYRLKNGADRYQENDILVPRRTLSPFGGRNVESLSLQQTKHFDPNHVEFALKINPTQTRGTGDSTEKEKSSDNEIPGKVNARGDAMENILLSVPKNPASRIANVVKPDPNSNMNVWAYTPEFSVTVTRKENNAPLLSTARGPLILTDNYWEMTLFLTNSTVYGLNKLELNGTTNWIYDNENGTSKIAFLSINDNGESTSCYVSYLGPMEIEIINESNLIVLRGFSLPSEISFHVFAGPKPLEAIAQLTRALRGNNDTIELSNLGLHVCPSEKTDNFIASLSDFVEAMKNTPWDSHCIHQKFFPTMGENMDNDEITVVEKAAELLSKNNRSIVPHLTPMVYRYNELAAKLDNKSLLLKNDAQSYAGLYNSREVFYPDWRDKITHEESLDHLNRYLDNFRSPKLVYLRDSWPKDERKRLGGPSHSTFDYLPPVLQNLMGNGTIPYTSVASSRDNYHYTEHASYSLDFSKFIQQRRNLTSFVVRGLWGESGNSTWAALTAAIRAGVGSGIVGQLPSPMYACGSSEKLSPGANSDELCDRWFGASVAWPHILSIRSNLPGGGHVSTTSEQYIIQHLQLRSSLMTYARTVTAQFFNDGLPVLAPTSVYYPEDLRARHTPNQFMWGDGILVGLVTRPGVYQVSMFLPGNHAWKLLGTGIGVDATSTGFAPITVTRGQLVTLIRPGFIIPVHEKSETTSAATVKGDLTLKIHRACVAFNCTARGTIFFGSHVSDGKFLQLSANFTHLRISGINSTREKACNRLEQTIISRIIVYNYPDPDKKIGNKINLCEIETDQIDIYLL